MEWQSNKTAYMPTCAGKKAKHRRLTLMLLKKTISLSDAYFPYFNLFCSLIFFFVLPQICEYCYEEYMEKGGYYDTKKI